VFSPREAPRERELLQQLAILFHHVSKQEFCTIVLVAAHAQLSAIEQYHFMVAVNPRMNLFDPRHIHQR
jgi:hypothetical protein